MGGRRLLSHERQLQVTDFPVDDRLLRKESDDLHPLAIRDKWRVHFIDLRNRPTSPKKQELPEKKKYGRFGRRAGQENVHRR
jgi:hypothetical protein